MHALLVLRGPLIYLLFFMVLWIIWFDFINRNRQEYMQGRGKGRLYLQNRQSGLVERALALGRTKAALSPVSGTATDLLHDLNQTTPFWLVSLTPTTPSEKPQESRITHIRSPAARLPHLAFSPHSRVHLGVFFPSHWK